MFNFFKKEKSFKMTDEIINAISHIAKTGEGSDMCLEKGCLPVQVHYYQPIPDIKELEKREVWKKTSKLSGINFEPEKYLDYLKELSKDYSEECNWPEDSTDTVNEFFLNNNSFSYGCASILHSIIRKNKPKRIIEIGSGFSTKIIREAVSLNILEGHSTEYTLIDPYTNYKKEYFAFNMNIINKPLETLDLKLFTSLQENDLLFIDSSHVCKIGSDVNFEILEILPILNKGVFIHFHDIPMPFEYPEVYSKNPAFRVFWNESYLLQAFLAFNKAFNILLPVNYIQVNHKEKFDKLFPHGINVKNWYSGSFWLQKVG
jgi:hypothetical protein